MACVGELRGETTEIRRVKHKWCCKCDNTKIGETCRNSYGKFKESNFKTRLQLTAMSRCEASEYCSVPGGQAQRYHSQTEVFKEGVQ